MMLTLPERTITYSFCSQISETYPTRRSRKPTNKMSSQSDDLDRRCHLNIIRKSLIILTVKSINMPSMESQCVKVDLCTLFKMIGGLIDVPFKPVFSARNPSSIIYQYSKSSLFKNSFFHRALIL